MLTNLVAKFFFKLVFLILLPVFILFYSCTDQKENKKQQNITTGLILYQANCANCHGKNGEGLGTAYPPLADTDYILKNKFKLPCIILKGMHEKIEISGKEFDLPMPAISLTDIEVAQVITYITNEWGNESEIFTKAEVAKNLIKCGQVK